MSAPMIDIAHHAYTIRAVVRSLVDAVAEVGPPGPMDGDAHDHIGGLVAAVEHLIAAQIELIERADEAEARHGAASE